MLKVTFFVREAMFRSTTSETIVNDEAVIRGKNFDLLFPGPAGTRAIVQTDEGLPFAEPLVVYCSST
jgi:hypothetical protein